MATTALGLSEKQQLLRLSGVGASEVWDVVNNPIVVYARKVGEAEPFEGNSLTEFGHRIERVIAEAWTARHPGLRVYTPGTLRHPEHEWALATLDRVVAPPGIGRPARTQWIEGLEIKVVFHRASEFSEDSDGIPERYQTQVQWQMEVADLDQVTLVALVNGDYREYPIKRDREMGAYLIDIVGRFWRDNVLAQVPPPVQGTDAYADFLKRRHPKGLAPEVEPTPESEVLVGALREAKARAAAAEEAELQAANALRAFLGESCGVTGLVSYKNNADGTKTDWEAVAREAAAPDELVAKHTTTKPGARVLRLITAKKGKK